MSHQILLVDDSATVQQLIRLAVVDEGIEVIMATNLDAARNHLRNRTPELVLVEISLPDGDGYTFCREVKDAHAGLPVLLLASARNPLDAARAKAAAADGSLTKPFQSIGALLETIKDLLGDAPSDTDPIEGALEIIEPLTARGAPALPLMPDPDAVLEIDEVFFVPPMDTARTTAAPDASIPLTNAQIEEIASRVALQIEDRLRRDLLAIIVPEATRQVLHKLDR